MICKIHRSDMHKDEMLGMWNSKDLASLNL